VSTNLYENFIINPVTTDDQLKERQSEIEAMLHIRSDFFHPNLRSDYLKTIQSLTTDILGKMSDMMQRCRPREEIHQLQKESFLRLKSTEEFFAKQNAVFQSMTTKQRATFRSNEEKIRGTSLNCDDLIMPFAEAPDFLKGQMQEDLLIAKGVCHAAGFAIDTAEQGLDFLKDGVQKMMNAATTMSKSIKPITEVPSQKAKAAKIANSPAVYRCFTKDGNYVTSVPSTQIPQYKDVYFHATGLDKAVGILSMGKIKRVDLGIYKGAFVSSKPELGYGAVVFALNRSIETVPVLNARFDHVPGSHWVGFSNSIPVNLNSLEYVAVDQRFFSEEEIQKLTIELTRAAGREIQVKTVTQVNEVIEQRKNDERICVPEDWPLTFEHLGNFTEWL
jgi:hypothetical protein